MPKEYENKAVADISGKEYFNVLGLRAIDAINILKEDKTPDVKSLNYLIESLLIRLKELQNLFNIEKPLDNKLKYLIEAIQQKEISAVKVDNLIDSLEAVIFEAIKRRFEYYATLSLYPPNDDNLLMTDTEDEVIVSHSLYLDSTDLYSSKKLLNLLSEGRKKDELLHLFNNLQENHHELLEKPNDDDSHSDLSIHSDSRMSSDSELEDLIESEESDEEQAKTELYPLKFSFKKNYQLLDKKIDSNEVTVEPKATLTDQKSSQDILPSNFAPKPLPQPISPPHVVTTATKTRHKILFSAALVMNFGLVSVIVSLLLIPVVGQIALVIGAGVGIGWLGILWGLKTFCASSKKTIREPAPIIFEEVKPTISCSSTKHLLNGQKLKTTVGKKLHETFKEANQTPTVSNKNPSLNSIARTSAYAVPLRRRNSF